jgi:D-3-phosphoglycerate dehydrogenase / 2-oxoglutarate reductase
MRVLVADALDPDAVAQLVAAGHDCEVAPGLSADELPDHVAGYDVLVVRSTKVTAKTIESGDVLSLVVRAGSGLNTIDRDAAAARRVVVANVPGANALAVAELTFALLLAIDRRIVDNTDAARAGRWDKKGLSAGARGLAGSAIGVVGLGAIGVAVAERALAFGMQVRTVGRDDMSERTGDAVRRLGIATDPDLVTLAGTVDVLSVHVPSGATTQGMVGRDVIAAMRPGAVLLNTSRADVVDSAALLEALDADRVRAGLDVFPDEPTATSDGWESPLAAHRNVVATEHIGASTAQAQRAVAQGVVDLVLAHAAARA